MEITIMELVQDYGLDSVLIAAAVCILTGLIKMPIKSLAAKTKDPSKYTKYITFLPLLLGFGVTVLYEYIMTHSVVFTGEFITLWLTSSSLSLAIYAFIEKFIPSRKKIMSAVTDMETSVHYDKVNKPGISNLMTIYASIKNVTIEDVEKEFVGANYGTFKRAVADAIVAELTPFQNRYREIIASGELDRVLKEGAEQASKIAEVTLEKVKKAIGLYQVK